MRFQASYSSPSILSAELGKCLSLLLSGERGIAATIPQSHLRKQYKFKHAFLQAPQIHPLSLGEAAVNAQVGPFTLD